MTKTASVLTIIAPDEQNLLNEEFLNSLKEHLNIEKQPVWLAEKKAVDLFLEVPSQMASAPDTIKQDITSYLQPYPLDFALQPLESRRKKLLISDMDSTIISEECIDEIAHMAGIKPKIASITERAMRGEIEFDSALKERVSLLKGLDTNALETVINERIHLNKGARTLVQTMAQNGAFCALVSGGFTFFTEKIAAMTGFHTTRANTLEMKDDKLTGNVIPPILGSAAKKHALHTFVGQHNINLEYTLAVGDGANDLEMINLSGLGVAYYAKPIVAEQADAAINHTDLTSLLYFQGYKKSEFITS